MIKRLKKYLNKLIYAKNIITKPLKLYFLDRSFHLGLNYRYYSKRLQLKDNLVLLEAAHGEKIGGNPYAIFKEMYNNSSLKHFKYVWVLNNRDLFYEENIKELKRVTIVSRNSKKYTKYLAQAKYLINDTTFHFFFRKREGQIYINTWHGTPIKTLGKHVKGTMGQHGNAIKNFLQADYIINPNKFTTDIINESHDLNGIFEGEIIESGYPRIDLTIHTDREVIKKRLEQTLGIQLNKKIIIYAPTWRGELGKSENINEDLLINIKKIKKNLSSDFILLLKMHNLSYKYLTEDASLKEICIPNWFETNELLAVTDVLITDYSSIAFDFLHTKKPIVFYAYDLNLYENSRGMYLNLAEEFMNVCKSEHELIDCLKDLQEVSETSDRKKYEQMINKYSKWDDGNASKRVVDYIFLKKNIEKVIVRKINSPIKKKIAIYAGGMITNGVTTSILNLLNNIDYAKYDITLLHGGNITKEIQTNLEKLPENVRVLFRMGTFNFTIKEYIYNYLILNYKLNKNQLEKFIPKNLYQIEFERNFGGIQFDTIIDYSGYAPIWTMMLVNSNIQNKVIYLHSEMKTDVASRRIRNPKVDINFNIIFNLYNKYDKLISVSEDVSKINQQNFLEHVDKEKFYYVSNPLDFNTVINNAKEKRKTYFQDKEYVLLDYQENDDVISFKGIEVPRHENVNFVSIGRLTDEKDPLKLVRAFKEIVEKYQNARLYIIGDGYLKKEVEDLIEILRLKDNISIVGRIDNPHALLDCCDCLVLSSNYEGQGLVILEALILEKPVIATNIPGPKGILENKQYGYLVENSVEGLITGMTSFVEEKNLFKTFDYETYNQKAMSDFYNNVCK
ncbi:hypothetical protein A0U40_08555 [[Bacillus] sp. KCTC 13219]|nr:hypothetical protein A0U40_08555 [[Bacillus] sp. KCTC 13219]